jgi:hypothetical protein
MWADSVEKVEISVSLEIRLEADSGTESPYRGPHIDENAFGWFPDDVYMVSDVQEPQTHLSG